MGKSFRERRNKWKDNDRVESDKTRKSKNRVKDKYSIENLKQDKYKNYENYPDNEI